MLVVSRDLEGTRHFARLRGGVLHQNQRHGAEVLGLQAVHTVHPGEKRLILRVLEMLDVGIKIADEVVSLVRRDRFDLVLSVGGEELEHAGLTVGAHGSLKYLQLVLLRVQRLDDLVLLQIVKYLHL